MATLFERVGGFATLSKVVLDFYERVLDDDALAPFFSETDMRRLIDYQTKFVAFLMDGPASFTDEHLRLAHSRHGIDAAAFDRMILVMRTTLEDFGIADRDVETVIGRMQVRRELIVVTAVA